MITKRRARTICKSKPDVDTCLRLNVRECGCWDADEMEGWVDSRVGTRLGHAG